MASCTSGRYLGTPSPTCAARKPLTFEGGLDPHPLHSAKPPGSCQLPRPKGKPAPKLWSGALRIPLAPSFTAGVGDITSPLLSTTHHLLRDKGELPGGPGISAWSLWDGRQLSGRCAVGHRVLWGITGASSCLWGGTVLLGSHWCCPDRVAGSKHGACTDLDCRACAGWLGLAYNFRHPKHRGAACTHTTWFRIKIPISH